MYVLFFIPIKGSVNTMGLMEKLNILSNAAKYDDNFDLNFDPKRYWKLQILTDYLHLL